VWISLCCMHPPGRAVLCKSTLTSITRSLTLEKGLSNPDGTYVYPEGMRVTSHNIPASSKNRMRTPRLVIIEFTLADLPPKGGPGQMLEVSLAANYVPNPEDLHYEQIHFDIKDEHAAYDAHTATVANMVAKLQEM